MEEMVLSDGDKKNLFQKEVLLVETVAEVAGKRINVEWVQGPVGVQSRNFSNERIYSTGWRARVPLVEGIKQTYPWIEAQVQRSKDAEERGEGETMRG